MGLRANDLEDMVVNIFEVDSFQSKMGDDRDVCVVSFIAKERSPARDMMEFIEKGYNFVLDSDVSSGEDNDGNYHVFVELQRDENLVENIKELISGINKLSGDLDWKFKFYKNPTLLDIDRLDDGTIPTSPFKYDMMLEQARVKTIESFFSKTYKETIVVEDNKVTIKKPFGMGVSFEIKQFGKSKDIQMDISETIKIDTQSTAETLWLTKVLGDFNITKYGDNFVLENGNEAMKISIL